MFVMQLNFINYGFEYAIAVLLKNGGDDLNIVDTTEELFKLWENNTPLLVEHLDSYYDKFPVMFDTYFKFHCTRTPERLNAAIERYSDTLGTMRRSTTLLPSIANEVYDDMSGTLQQAVPLEIRLLVGGYGSNAYVTHDGTLYFAVELMPDEPAFLRVLVAHEMAHAFHLHMLREAG